MTVTLHEPRLVGDSLWLVMWESTEDDPLFRVYLDGQLFEETPANNMLIVVPADGAYVIEVLDDDAPPTLVGEGYAVLSWNETAATAQYRIDKYTGGEWVEVAVVPAGRSVHRLRLQGIPGATILPYRVVPIGEGGNEGTAAEVDVNIAKLPAPPVVSFAFNRTTNELTISAA